MKNILKLEEVAMFALSIYFFNQLDYAWWVYLVWLLTPDISMLGYLAGTKVGAYTYNLFHHTGVAIAVFLIGLYIQSNPVTFAGILLFGHSSMDRIFDYGLKYTDSFQHTHLGMLKPPKAKP